MKGSEKLRYVLAKVSLFIGKIIGIIIGTMFVFGFGAQTSLAVDSNFNHKLSKTTLANKVATDVADIDRVVTVYTGTLPEKNKTKKDLTTIHTLPPAIVFETYKQAVINGDLDAYDNFYSKALLTKTYKGMSNYTKQQVINLKRLNQKMMACRSDKLISESVQGYRAIITYEVTNHCTDKKTPSKNYQRVNFKRELDKVENKHTWKIDRLILSKYNDFDAYESLRLEFGTL